MQKSGKWMKDNAKLFFNIKIGKDGFIQKSGAHLSTAFLDKNALGGIYSIQDTACLASPFLLNTLRQYAIMETVKKAVNARDTQRVLLP